MAAADALLTRQTGFYDIVERNIRNEKLDQNQWYALWYLVLLAGAEACAEILRVSGQLDVSSEGDGAEVVCNEQPSSVWAGEYFCF